MPSKKISTLTWGITLTRKVACGDSPSLPEEGSEDTSRPRDDLLTENLVEPVPKSPPEATERLPLAGLRYGNDHKFHSLGSRNGQGCRARSSTVVWNPLHLD